MSPKWGEWTAQRALAAAAMVLGVLAAVAGRPTRGANGRVDVAALARVVEREEDRVSAIELARLIRDRTPNLRVIDLRSAEAVREYRIPGAEHMSLADLATRDFDRQSTIVLYSDGGTHAAQGWFLLRARGLDRVYSLRGGLVEWIDQIMEARIASDATQAERDAFRELAELSRYFGGQPSVSDRPRSVLDGIPLPVRSDSGAASEAARRLRRRGC